MTDHPTEKETEKKVHDEKVAEHKAAAAAAKRAATAVEKEKKARRDAGWPQIADMVIVLGQLRTGGVDGDADADPAVVNSTEKLATPEAIAAVRAALPPKPLTALQQRSAEVHARTLTSGASPALCLVSATLLIAHTRTVYNVPCFADEDDARAYHGTVGALSTTDPDGKLTAYVKE